MAIMIEKLSKRIDARINNGLVGKVQLLQNTEQRIFRDALTRAYTIWAPQNWEWVDSLFNEHFLTYRATNFLIKYYMKDRSLPEPIELANLWAEQFKWFDEEMRQRHIAKLTPVAAEFLRSFETELQFHLHDQRNSQAPKLQRHLA